MTSERQKTHYEVLQVDPTASAAVIQGAYRALLKDAGLHPDLGGAPELAQAINEAYAVLSDPKLRREYDRRLGNRPRPVPDRGPVQAPPQYILICPGCRKRNLVPDERFLEEARCGACNRLLVPRSVRDGEVDHRRAFRLGLFLFDKGLFDRALRELQAAVRGRPKDPGYRYWLGRCLYQKRWFDKARTEFQAAVTLRPSQFHFRFWLGQSHHALKEWAGALAQFTEAARLRPRHVPTLLRLSSYHYQLGDYDRAIALLQQVVAREPNRTHPHKWLGLIYLARNDPKAALAEFNLAERLSPGNPHTRKYIELCRRKIA